MSNQLGKLLPQCADDVINLSWTCFSKPAL